MCRVVTSQLLFVSDFGSFDVRNLPRICLTFSIACISFFVCKVASRGVRSIEFVLRVLESPLAACDFFGLLVIVVCDRAGPTMSVVVLPLRFLVICSFPNNGK